MKDCNKINRLRLTFGLLAIFLSSSHAGEKIATGDSVITRDKVDIALHVPAAASGEHGPFGVFVFFGGVGDSNEYYQKAYAEMADKLDFIVVVPRMPWFATKGEVDTPGVIKALDGLVADLETQFHTEPNLCIVGGASAGGGAAHNLAQHWGAKVPFLILHSTLDRFAVKGPRLLHLVGRDESAWLGTDAHGGKGFDVNNKDLYAVPDEEHQAHIRDTRPWLETELSAWRLEKAGFVITGGPNASSEAAIRSHKESLRLLSETLQGDDAFLQFQNKRRKDLKLKLETQLKGGKGLPADPTVGPLIEEKSK